MVIAAVIVMSVLNHQNQRLEIEVLSETNRELEESIQMLRLDVAVERLAKQDAEIRWLTSEADRLNAEVIEQRVDGELLDRFRGSKN